MGFFGKKDVKRLPDLPSPREAGLSGMDEDEEKHALPSFPDSPSHNRFSQAMIKDAVSMKNDLGMLTEVPNEEGKMKVVEMDEWRPRRNDEHDSEIDHEKFMPPNERIPPREPTIPMALAERPTKIPKMEPMPEIKPSRIASVNSSINSNMNSARKDNPGKEVFVKIDKYYTARKAISEIAERLENIDEMVRKIREVKLREEQELAAWERDIMQTRTRIQEINQNLFDKTE